MGIWQQLTGQDEEQAPWSQASNTVNTFLSDLNNNANRELSNVMNIGKDGIAGIGKNVERSARNQLQGLALLASGNWNNADRTLLDMTLTAASGGAYLAVNPDDVSNNVKSTPMERLTSEAVEQAKADAAASAQAEKDRRIGEVNNAIAGIIGGQRRSPGRGATLLSSSYNPSSTLLTTRGA